MIDCIDPEDPMSHFAKQLALWYEEEAKQTRRRINRGIAQTQREGKWTGRRPPIHDRQEWLSGREHYGRGRRRGLR